MLIHEYHHQCIYQDVNNFTTGLIKSKCLVTIWPVFKIINNLTFFMQFNLLALLRILNLQHLRLLNVVKYGYGTYDLPFFLNNSLPRFRSGFTPTYY